MTVFNCFCEDPAVFLLVLLIRVWVILVRGGREISAKTLCLLSFSRCLDQILLAYHGVY